MINYLSSNLSVSIYQFSYQELNLLNTKSYVWNSSLIIFGAFYNYTDKNFQNLALLDGAGNDILHLANTHRDCYTVAFSGSATGSPLYNLPVNNLNQIIFDWNLSGVAASGSLIVKLYYI